MRTCGVRWQLHRVALSSVAVALSACASPLRLRPITSDESPIVRHAVFVKNGQPVAPRVDERSKDLSPAEYEAYLERLLAGIRGAPVGTVVHRVHRDRAHRLFRVLRDRKSVV